MPQQMPWDIARTFKDKRDGPYQITQPQDPAVLEQRGLGNAATRTTIDKNNIDIGNAPLTRENLQANINQSRNAVTNSTIDNEAKLRTEFMGAPSVKEFQQALPKFIAATRAADNPVGDMQIITAWVKAYDPTGSVMTGDVTTAEQAQSAIQKLTGQTQALFGGNGRLTPEVRKNFLDETHTRLSSLADAYRQERANYSHISQRTPGVNPDNVIGDPFQKAFQQGEADYLGRPIRNLDGTQGMAPHGQERVQAPLDPNGQGDIGFNQPRADPGPAMSGEQQGAYDAFWRANPHATPEQLHAFGTSIGVDIHNADAIIHARKMGAGVQPGSTAILQPPDISDVRGGKNTPTQDGYNSLVRGILDAPTFGTFDKLAAGANTLFDGGTMKDNLAREYAISDYDQAQHPYLRMGGQAFGGALIPVGEMGSLAQIAAKSGGMGAAYGAGSSRSFGDVPANVLLGGATGAALGAGIGKAAQYMRGRNGMAEMPPLVDPVTGRLNEPLEAAGPAGRIAAGRQFGIDMPYGSAGDRTASIVEKGLDNLPGSAGVMNDARRVTEGQVNAAAEGVANKFGGGRTMYDAGTAAQDGSKNWISRFEKVAGQAYDAIPISDKAPAVLNGTRATLDQLTSAFSSNPDLAGVMQSPKLLRYQEALKNGGLSWADTKAFRSSIGNEIGEQRFSDSPTKDQMRALYGALSEDMRNTAASQGPGALRAFERANTLYAQGQARIDGALVHILGNDSKKSPEAAAAAIQAIAKSGKGSGNLDRLAQVRASTVKDGSWDTIASSLIRMGGQATGKEGATFNPRTFVDWYSGMTEDARKLLFSGGNGELRKSLDQFVAVNQRIANSNALRNTSNTAPAMMAAGTVGALGMAAMNPLLGLKLAGGMAANYGMGKLWTSPAFVRWATGYSQSLAQGSGNAVKSQIGRLGKLAVANPELQAPLVELQRHLLSGANDNIGQMGRAAASPDQRPDQEQRPYR